MTDMNKASLDEIRRMKDRGDLHHDPEAPAGGELLSPEFWANACLEPARSPRSVHLRLDPDVFDFFKNMGKGHLTKMQDVLKAYVRAHSSG